MAVASLIGAIFVISEIESSEVTNDMNACGWCTGSIFRHMLVDNSEKS